jgi:hypothetical protein
MSEKPEQNQVEEQEAEVEVEEQDGELLPDREAMNVFDPLGGITGGLGPPQLDPTE